MFWNRAPILAYWYLPNTLDSSTCWSGPESFCNALENSVISPMKSPLFSWAIFFMLMPYDSATADAALVGDIRLAKPDFRAFAPSAALTPPSRIAVSNTDKSSMLPPSPLMTGATRGIACVMSSRLVIVWFSTALRKFVFAASSSLETPNADCILIVASSACW